jgi:hypothetical protein
MTEGYFINITTGKAYPVNDHELAVRKKEFAKKLGIPDAVFAQFGKYTPVEDRKEFLFWLLKQVPIIRVRGYGVWVAIQWGCASDKKALASVHKFGKTVFGPCSMLRMCNIKTAREFNSFWISFDEAMKANKRIKSVPVLACLRGC